MACFYPRLGFRSRSLSPTGKRPIVFNANEGYPDLTVTVPCGRCIGCRLERSRHWAVRCVHEASLHDANCFLTLTYSDKDLPVSGSLVLDDVQRFIKRLRKALDVPVRYFLCGEYGEKLSRPHYHVLLFGFDFSDDRTLWVNSRTPLYRSPRLEKIWTAGHCLIGELTFESAAYVARYILKKVADEDFYKDKLPPFICMSRRPGIGRAWYERFKGDVFPSDEVIIRNGLKCRPSKYYDALFDLESPEVFEKIKQKRLLTAKARSDDSSAVRLRIREECMREKVKRKVRSYEASNI